MKKNNPTASTISTTLPLGDYELNIGRLGSLGTGPGMIRLSGWIKGRPFPGPLELSENELVELIHQAIHAGVLSHDFMGKLRERIEI
jgi:hypothetical protein